MNDKPMQFKFSLSTLNHLGRGLYRSFATVIAEAISNAWDADAECVNIQIEKETLTIWDDGTGMNRGDMQDKFLKIGYSKRDFSERSEKKKRHVLGRKGIGKLAYLSISKEITIISRKEGEEEVSVQINNKSLDSAIDKGRDEQEYELPPAIVMDKEKCIVRSGTQLTFKGLYPHLKRKNIRQILAVHFHFAHALGAGDKFDVFVNGSKIGPHDLKELFNKTQFVWFFGETSKSEFMNEMRGIFGESVDISQQFEKCKILEQYPFTHEGKPVAVRGYIASVHEPRFLYVPGTDNFKASVALFAGGRLRESEIVPKISVAQIPENYLFGQIHVDDMDGNDIDRFTSARDSVKEDDPLYSAFLQFLQGVLRRVIGDWKEGRRKWGDPGDSEDAKNKIADAMDDSYMRWVRKNARIPRKEYATHPLTTEIREIAKKNLPSYVECFVAENLMRFYAHEQKLHQALADKIAPFKKRETLAQKNENISFPIRDEMFRSGSNDLNYAGFSDLAHFIDVHENMNKKTDSLSKDTARQKIVRDALMHTASLTDEARKQGSVSWINVVHKILDLLKK